MTDTLKSKKIIGRAYKDFKFFCDEFFKPKHISSPYNKMHTDYFKSFNPVEKGVHKVIMAARGSAKTSFICLFDVLHRVCYGNEKYILILSSTKPLAIGKTQDIYNEIIENEKLRLIYGLKFINKRNSKESFVIESHFGICLIRSQGFFSQIRGTKFKSERPTRIILDDVTHGVRVFSEVQRKKEIRQYHTDVKQAGQPETNNIIVGTPLQHSDLISEKFKDPLWDAKKYKAIINPPVKTHLWERWTQIYTSPLLNPEKKKLKQKSSIKNTKKIWIKALFYFGLKENRFIS